MNNTFAIFMHNDYGFFFPGYYEEIAEKIPDIYVETNPSKLNEIKWLTEPYWLQELNEKGNYKIFIVKP